MTGLERWDDLDAAREEWSALAAASGNLFATWEWADAWRRHLSHSGSAHVLAARDRDGRPAVILPLWLTRTRGLRIVRFVGHGSGDHLGPICAAGAEAEGMAALRRGLDELAPDWDVILAENLAGPHACEPGLGGVTLRREISPVVTLAGDWESFVAGRTQKLRRDIRHHERRLQRDHAVRFRLADDPTRLSADLDQLFALHALRWGPQSRGLGPANRRFHGDFAARALARGWLRLWFLDVDERPVAAAYGFRFAGADWFYQGGRDPVWDTKSVGSVLVMHTLREAFQDGIGTYRMLRGDEGYKQRLTSEADAVVTVALGRGVRGRTAVRLAAEARRRPGLVRALRAGVGRSRWQALGGNG